jgi:hypothetical protein
MIIPHIRYCFEYNYNIHSESQHFPCYERDTLFSYQTIHRVSIVCVATLGSTNSCSHHVMLYTSQHRLVATANVTQNNHLSVTTLDM